MDFIPHFFWLFSVHVFLTNIIQSSLPIFYLEPNHRQRCAYFFSLLTSEHMNSQLVMDWYLQEQQ